MNHRMGYPAIATWIAEEYPSDRKPQRTPVRVRLSEDAQAARRILDVPPKRAAQKKSLLDRANELLWDADEGGLYVRLVEMRGGCRCFISPPCKACSDPITEDEALILLDEEEDAPPQADADGWIAWGGGECPIPGKRFDVRLRNGCEYYWCEHMQTASDLRWSKEGYEGDIIAYRPVEEAKESDEIKAGDLVEVIGEPSRIGIAEECKLTTSYNVFIVNGVHYYVKRLRKIDPHSEPLRLGDVIDVNRLSRIVITQFSLDWWNMAENRRRVRLVRRYDI